MSAKRRPYSLPTLLAKSAMTRAERFRAAAFSRGQHDNYRTLHPSAHDLNASLRGGDCALLAPADGMRRESVSHVNTQSAHDDVAAAAAGALVLAASRPSYNFWWPLGLNENGELQPADALGQVGHDARGALPRRGLQSRPGTSVAPWTA